MTPKKAYYDQRCHALSRGIPWCFIYESWLEMWLVSGKWDQRGRQPDQYCMCRYGDEGSYSPKNCFIATNEENQRQRWENKEKITNPTAKKILDMYLSRHYTQKEVADLFGVSQSYVSRIVNKKRKKAA